MLARLALVRALGAAGDERGALLAAREANALSPNVPHAIIALGDTLLAAGHLPAAIAEYQRALRLDPNSADARFRLGRAWAEAGEMEKALEQFALILPGSVPELEKQIAAIEALRGKPRSHPGYVRHLFDQFSSDYDARMRNQLAYRAPEILRELADLVMPGAKNLVALDLGCGTGLTAEVFVDIAPTLDGIDLSPAMVEKARARRVYRNLDVADIETGLSGGGGDYDLVLAADTLVYLGELLKTFLAIERRLRPGGFFLLRLRKAPDPISNSDPNAAGGTASPIFAAWRRITASRSPDCSIARRAARREFRSRAWPWRSRSPHSRLAEKVGLLSFLPDAPWSSILA